MRLSRYCRRVIAAGVGTWLASMTCRQMAADELAVSLVLRPCCYGFKGQCLMVSHAHCVLLEGHYHERGPEHCAQVTASTRRHPPAPTGNYQQPPAPTSTHQHPPAPTSTHRQLSATTGTHQDSPATISNHRHPPVRTSTHQHPPAPTSTHQHLPAPTSAHQHPPAIQDIIREQCYYNTLSTTVVCSRSNGFR